MHISFIRRKTGPSAPAARRVVDQARDADVVRHVPIRVMTPLKVRR